MPQRLVKKKPFSHVGTKRTTKLAKRNKSPVVEVVGDVIVVDTGIIEGIGTNGEAELTGETRTAGDNRSVEDNGTVKKTLTVEDVNPKSTSASVGSEATQKARDALFLLEPATDFHSISLYIPSLDGQQSRITRPLLKTYQSASATDSSSGLANHHNAEQSSPPRDAPDESSKIPGWSGANATASALLANPLPASSLENIRVAADHPLPATTVSGRHCGPSSRYLRPIIPDSDDTTTQQMRSIPAQVNHVSRQSLNSIKDSSPSHHNSIWMDVVTGVLETSRTANDKKMLRDWAAELIAGRVDVELEGEETTGGRNRVYPEACGLVVDKSSAKGLVAITDQGFTVQQVDTGQGLMIGEPYAELTIRVGQTCVIHGSSTVLYYKPRKVPASDHARPSSIHEVVKLASSPPEIALRLQIDEGGRFSAPYDFSIWSRKLKTIEFFAWFRRETGRGGVKGPPLLTFTLKDAMPQRKSRDIAILDKGDFRWMRKHIIKQFDKAKLCMPGLKDFTILVTDPKWVSAR